MAQLTRPSSVVEPVVDPEADAACDRFLRAISHTGICELGLTRDGRLQTIETDPRYSVTADAAPYPAIDIGWLQDLATSTHTAATFVIRL